MKRSHVFDPAHIEILESEERKLWQKPDEILGAVEFERNWIAADLGCGSGYFTVPLAYRVKKVYAIDVQKEMLGFLEQKIKKLGVKNIVLLKSKQNEIPLDDGSVDFLMTVNTLHEFGDRAKMIQEMKRVLTQRGVLLIVDFKKENTGFGPPVSIRVAKERAVNLFEDNGFKLKNEKDLPYDYLLVFVKA